MSEENKHRRILGSQAIFPRDAGHEAPGCVVGFKFRHSRLNKRFNSILKMNTAIVSSKFDLQSEILNMYFKFSVKIAT